MECDNAPIQLPSQVEKSSRKAARMRVVIAEVPLKALGAYDMERSTTMTRKVRSEVMLRKTAQTAGRPISKDHLGSCSCTFSRPRMSGATSALSLRAVLLLVSAAMLLFPFICVTLVSPGVGFAAQSPVEQIRHEIEATDRRIGEKVTSFFYLSHVNPCSEHALQRIIISYGLRVDISGRCIWEYKDLETGTIIARDHWDEETYRLQQREYFSDSDTLIALDTFDWHNTECCRSRTYSDGHTECYSEAGELQSGDPGDTWIAPIPPMVYWFFYK